MKSNFDQRLRKKRAANARLTAVEVIGRLPVSLFKSRVPSKVRDTARSAR
jgi:hypothetical protein